MNNCLYCGRPLPVIYRLSGAQPFCTREHLQLHRARTARESAARTLAAVRSRVAGGPVPQPVEAAELRVPAAPPIRPVLPLDAPVAGPGPQAAKLAELPVQTPAPAPPATAEVSTIAYMVHMEPPQAPMAPGTLRDPEAAAGEPPGMKRVAEGAIPPMPRFGEKPEETEEGTPLRDWVQVALPRASMGVEPRQFLPAPQGMIGYSTPLCRAKAVPPAPPRDWPMAAMLDDQAMAAIAVAPATDLGGLPLPVELPRLDRPAHFAWASTCVSGIIRLEPELTPSELATVPQVKWAARVEGLFVPRLRFRTWRPRLVAGPRPEGMDISRGAFRLRPAAIPETRTIAPSPTILRMTAPKPQAPGPLPARPAPLTFNPKPLRNADHE